LSFKNAIFEASARDQGSFLSGLFLGTSTDYRLQNSKVSTVGCCLIFIAFPLLPLKKGGNAFTTHLQSTELSPGQMHHELKDLILPNIQ